MDRLNRFDLFGRGLFQMGQDANWSSRADQAIANYDALIRRTSVLEDGMSRSEILEWIGDGSIPGTPSDRYRFVVGMVDQGGPWDSRQMQYLEDLEDAVAELQARVSEGEQAGVYGKTGLSVVNPQGQLTQVGVGLVVVAALGLLVVPMALK